MSGSRTDRFRRVDAVFDAALDLPGPDRLAFIDRACGDDAELRAEVLELLRAHQASESFLEGGAATMAAHFVRAAASPGGPVADRIGPIDVPRDGARRIGPYRLLRELGRGGMGVVHLAERDDGQFRRRVAVKVLRASPDSEDLHRRFLAERQILASLSHPHIAQLLDGGVSDDQLPYLVIEYVDGLPITDYCDRHRLGVEARLGLFQDVCAAVHHAHQNLVLHRDLKPGNVLVTPDGHVKLLDFGIAKLLNPTLGGSEQPVTRTAFRLMTPAYASPEQVRGDPLTTASDVYALGLLLYELLVGRPAHRITTDSPREVYQAVCERVPERPSTAALDADAAEARDTTPERLARKLRGDLDRVVLFALQKEPERRYASAEAFATDVERYLNGRTVAARGDSAAYRARKFVRRNAWAVAAAVAFALMLGSYAATVTVQAEQVRTALDQARIEADRASQLSALLLGLFETPRREDEAASDSAAVRRLLQRGLARAEQMHLQPEARAQTLTALGRVYQHLGEYDRAAPLLEQALALNRQAYGARHLNTAETLVALAEVYRYLYRTGSAEALLREALATERALLGPTHPRVARTLSGLSMVRRDAGDLADAERLARDALAMRRRIHDGDHPALAQGLDHLAGVLGRRGDFEGARPLYEEALAMRRRLYRGDHIEIAQSLNDLAVHRQRMGDLAGSTQLFDEALAMYRRLVGDDHPLVANTTANLGLAVGLGGDADSADLLLRRALAVQRHVFGESHPVVAMGERLLGLQLTRRGTYAEAEVHYRASLAMLRAHLGATHPEVALSAHGLGRVLRLQGKLDAAEPHLRDALRVRDATLGSEHPLTANTLHELGALLAARGAHAEAESLLLRALAIRRRRPADAADAAESAAQLAALYQATGRPREAAEYRRLAADH